MPENQEKGIFTGKMKIVIVFDFLLHISAFQLFLIHFGKIWTICASKNQSETNPAYTALIGIMFWTLMTLMGRSMLSGQNLNNYMISAFLS
jgi:hypothetical protein